MKKRAGGVKKREWKVLETDFIRNNFNAAADRPIDDRRGEQERSASASGGARGGGNIAHPVRGKQKMGRVGSGGGGNVIDQEVFHRSIRSRMSRARLRQAEYAGQQRRDDRKLPRLVRQRESCC